MPTKLSELRRSSSLKLQLLLLGPLLLLTAKAPAQELTPKPLSQYQSERVLFPDENSPYAVLNPGHYPALLSWFLNQGLAWTPTGESANVGTDCDSRDWQSGFLQQSQQPDLAKQAHSIRSYWDRCRSQLETGIHSDGLNGMGMMTMKFRPHEHPFLHRVVFELPGGIHLKGLLALKGDQKKRPLVIVRLGIFANVEEFYPERFFMMPLFEQSPFNVLFVESMSGNDFLHDNTSWGFGGYDEGLQNILIAKILRDPKEPLSSLVSSLHLLGLSLGGNGALFASLLNETNFGPQGQKLYNSFIGMCPVVNLKESMLQLSQPGMNGSVMDAWSGSRLEGLQEKIPQLKEYGVSKFLSMKPFYMTTAIQEVTARYHGGLSYDPSVKLPEGMENTSDFWANNHFWPYYHDVHSPVLVMVTEHDNLVPVKYNSALFATKEFQSMHNNLQVVSFDWGHHCSLPVAYDWEAVASLLESYFVSYSPEFHWQTEVKDTPIKSQTLATENARIHYAVEWPKNGHTLKLNGKASSPLHSENFTLSLPASEFDFKFPSASFSPSEKDMLIRWMNHNLRLKVLAKEGKEILRAEWRKM